jgi:hypothetical protein
MGTTQHLSKTFQAFADSEKSSGILLIRRFWQRDGLIAGR